MSDGAEVSAVVFDVGRVLFEWDLRLIYVRLIDDADRLDWFLANVVTEEWHAGHDAGRDLGEMVAERKRQFPGHDDLIDAYATRFNDSIPGPVPGTHALIDELHARGVPLFAITNFAAPFWADFQPTEPVFDCFRDIVVSGQERIVKPDPAIFELAATRFGIAPAEMLFIDDNPANVSAAYELGWHVHHFTGADELAADLRERGLIG